MSDKEQDARAFFDEADVHAIVYASSECPFCVNDTSLNACSTTKRNDLVQQETEETFFTPEFKKFPQWRQMDRSPADGFPFAPKMMRDESTSEMSLCDESLIEQVKMLTRRDPRASTRIADVTPNTSENSSERRDRFREDLLARCSRAKRTLSRSRIFDRDEISAGNERKDETSDYSTMESIMINNDGSSSKVTSDSSIDQLPPRGTGQSDRPSRQDATVVSFAKPKTKEARNPVIAESTRLADHSARSPGKPSVIGDGEVFETDTFDDLYSRNVELVQHYVERMIKEREGSCFASHWSRKIIKISMCRSPPWKKFKEKSHERADMRASSPVRENVARTSSADVLEQADSIKLRFATSRKKKQVQILERSNSGNALHLGGKWSIDDRGVPRGNNNDSNLELPYVFASARRML